MVDLIVLERILADIKECICDLQKAQNITRKEYSRDKRTRRFVERTLHIAIEAMIDAAQHIIADEGLREPASYRDSFLVLAEEGVISMDNLDKFQQMAAFRNLIVHYYERIDDDVIFEIFHKNIGDFEIFVEEISLFIKNAYK